MGNSKWEDVNALRRRFSNSFTNSKGVEYLIPKDKDRPQIVIWFHEDGDVYIEVLGAFYLKTLAGTPVAVECSTGGATTKPHVRLYLKKAESPMTRRPATTVSAESVTPPHGFVTSALTLANPKANRSDDAAAD